MQCRPDRGDMRDTRPRWGLMSAGGPTPYPHIALCATAPKSIYSRRTGRMPSDVQKRCLPSRAAAGPESLRGQNTGLTARGTDSNPHENRLEPPWCSERPRCGMLQANRQPVHWTGRRRPRRSQELQSRGVIGHMVVNRANARRTPITRLGERRARRGVERADRPVRRPGLPASRSPSWHVLRRLGGSCGRRNFARPGSAGRVGNRSGSCAPARGA
jgi:hypothetical protein